VTGSHLLTSVSPKADTALAHLVQATPSGPAYPFGLSFDLLIGQAIDNARRSPPEITRPAWNDRAASPEPRRPAETRDHDDVREAPFAIAVVEPPHRDPAPAARRVDPGDDAPPSAPPGDSAAPTDPRQPKAASSPSTGTAPADPATPSGRLPAQPVLPWLDEGSPLAGAKAAPDAPVPPRPQGPIGPASTPSAQAAANGTGTADPSLAAALREVRMTAVKEADHLVSQPAATRVPWTAGIDTPLVAGERATGNATAQGAAVPSPAQSAAPAAGPTASATATLGATLGAALGAAAGTQPSAAPAVAGAAVVAAAQGGEPQAQRPLGEAPGGPVTSTAAAGPTVPGGPARSTGSGPTAPQRPATLPMDVPEQVRVRIAHAVAAGHDRIEIRLKPAELGRLDIRLELAGDGRVQATITADNRQTLELLRADARGLERALQDAGLRTDSGGLSFNLRGDGDAPAREWSSETRGGEAGARAIAEEEAAANPATPGATSASATGRIDIRA
jgi:flagellar hook-length control protein FliK